MIVAVLSDIHSNLVALEAVLASLGSVDAIWHLGDTVGYGPEPQAVLDRLRAVGAVGVRGNHDDAGGGGSTIDFFNPDGYAAMVWTRNRIDEQAQRYLAGLPERLTPFGSGFTLAHGSPRDPIWEYLDSSAVALENMAAFETPYCLVGHTHKPVVYRERRGRMEFGSADPESQITLGRDRLIMNPGSVGQPRDGDPRAAFMVIDTARAVATWHRVAYDVAATQAAIMAAGLPRSLADRLARGR